MTRKTHPDVWRGMKEQRTAIPLLQQRWPAVFPHDPRQVRPLASTIVATIVTEFGWSKPYTKGVLNAWKHRDAYGSAVLLYDDRLDLDGAPSGERVDEAARSKAQSTLAAKADLARGMREATASMVLLQQRWPLAFPQDPRQVRPLAGTIVATIVAELGWSQRYVKGVLKVWKDRVAYCNAVLRYDERVDLAGTPSGVLVCEPARAMARTNLAAIAQHRQRRAEREAEATQSIATTAAAEPASPVTVKASPSPPAAANPAASGRRSRPILTLTSMRAAQ